MSTPFARVQPALALGAARPHEDVPLAALAARAGLSPFHLHRMFAAVAGETPKQYTLRIRVSRGAVLLLTTSRSVLDVALSCGFASHEAFIRAFRRQFGLTPRAYRARGFATPEGRAGAAMHARLVARVAPCVGLYRMGLDHEFWRHDMTYAVEKKSVNPQPVLVARRRVKRSDIAAAIGDALPRIFQYAQQHGLALAGHPITRYVDVGPGMLTIEPGMRVTDASPAAGATSGEPGDAASGAVLVDTLPGGPVVVTTHTGPYETLQDAYAALEAWMESHELQPAGAPWESYITDPAEHPDPKDWKTEVYWPVRGVRS